MIFISDKNEYPRYLGDIKLLYPDWKEGDVLPEGWSLVIEESQKPELAEDEVLVELFPIEENGLFRQNFTVRKMTEKELAKKQQLQQASEDLRNQNLTPEEKRDAFFRLYNNVK